MLYIVTEDENSARDFFECVAFTFKDKNEYQLVPLINKNGGNTTLYNQVKQVFKYIKSGDTIMVVFDNISNTKTFNPADFIHKLIVSCNKKNVKHILTTYYCFEELYLSYDELIDMYVKRVKTNNYVIDALKYVHDCINNNVNYFNNDARIQNFISNRKEAGINREHFALQLLIKATEVLNGHGYFKLIKEAGTLKNKGKCWLENCHNIQHNMNEYQIENICNKNCLYCCKNKTTKEKLMDLNNRSLFRISKMKLYEI